MASGIRCQHVGIVFRLPFDRLDPVLSHGSQGKRYLLFTWFAHRSRLVCQLPFFGLFGILRFHIGLGCHSRIDRSSSGFFCKVREHLDGRPLLDGCHPCDFTYKSRRHRVDGSEQDAVYRAQRLHVGIGSMGRYGSIERSNEIDQPMGFESRQRDAREIERVDPRVFRKRRAVHVLRCEITIELGVVRHDVRCSNEFDKIGESLGGSRGIGDVFVMDIRQPRNIFGNRLSRIHECHEPFDDFPVFHPGGGDLRQFIVVDGKSRGLRIENDDIAIELSVIGALRGFVQTRVPIADIAGRAFDDVFLYGICLLRIIFFHRMKPIIYHDVAQTERSGRGIIA